MEHNKGRTGASQGCRELLWNGSVQLVTTANGSGGSFGGQDSRLNNFTIDGSVLIMVSDLVMTHKQEVELVLLLFH
jgi:hypothetical protein